MGESFKIIISSNDFKLQFSLSTFIRLIIDFQAWDRYVDFKSSEA